MPLSITGRITTPSTMPESHLHEKLPASVRTHVPDLDTDERQQQPQPPKVSELAQTPTEAILFAELSEAGQNVWTFP